ncbi:DUF6163 family protein [Acuticoccus yangtzensis]|uniref:DUF6163 family protein n=1 Tax=Acuticoccus yangtzensis TaxID=1443441 RepID=UPI000949599E|nr:DUF6163 family protein [Acuticoccus yangtzensis]
MPPEDPRDPGGKGPSNPSPPAKARTPAKAPPKAKAPSNDAGSAEDRPRGLMRSTAKAPEGGTPGGAAKDGAAGAGTSGAGGAAGGAPRTAAPRAAEAGAPRQALALPAPGGAAPAGAATAPRTPAKTTAPKAASGSAAAQQQAQQPEPKGAPGRTQLPARIDDQAASAEAKAQLPAKAGVGAGAGAGTGDARAAPARPAARAAGKPARETRPPRRTVSRTAPLSLAAIHAAMAGHKEGRDRLGILTDLVVRVSAVAWLIGAVVVWTTLIGYQSAAIEASWHSPSGPWISTSVAAVVMPVISVGLWLAGSWGVVLWGSAVLAALVFTIIAPGSVPFGPVALAANIVALALAAGLVCFRAWSERDAHA